MDNFSTIFLNLKWSYIQINLSEAENVISQKTFNTPNLPNIIALAQSILNVLRILILLKWAKSSNAQPIL